MGSDFCFVSDTIGYHYETTTMPDAAGAPSCAALGQAGFATVDVASARYVAAEHVLASSPLQPDGSSFDAALVHRVRTENDPGRIMFREVTSEMVGALHRQEAG